MPKAAVYHFTNKSTQRPKICRDQVHALVEHATSVGLDVTDIYCDKSLRRSDQTEFERFLANADQYDALVAKDFHHISKNTSKCIKIMQQLRDKGLQIYTVDNGIFTWEEPSFDKPLRVASYTCHFGTPNEMKEVIPVKNDIFKLFIANKTKWTLVDQYFDESLYQKNGEQIQLKKLLDNRDCYDLLLVHNMNDIHWRTANFCRIRELLRKDIYSLQEGFLKYGRNL